MPQTPKGRANLRLAQAAPMAEDDTSAPGEPEIVPGSEDAMAAEFASLYRHLFRYTHGMGWMRCLPQKWVPDTALTAFDCARQVARLAAGDEANDKLRRSMCSARTIGAITTIARSDPQLALEADQWDAHPFELNTPSGVVDLRTGRLRHPSEGDYFTRVTRVAPDLDAKCPTWLRFLDDVFCGDPELVDFVQRLVGYTFTGERTEQKLFFLQGSGANGKSTFLDFVGSLAGDYMLKLPAQVLMHNPVQTHPTELAQLRGKRLAISSEIEEGQYWAESRIKELTGDETLTARFMRQDFFTFTQSQKHLIAGNYKPRLRGGDAALARRFVLIPFAAKFTGAKRDPKMIERLHAEAPAVMAWIVAGAVRWYAEGMTVPDTVVAASADYMSENDDVAMWIEERCVVAASAKARATPLYADYLSWLKARGQHAPSMKTWADRLAVVPGIAKRKSHGAMVYEGIGLRAEDLLDA